MSKHYEAPYEVRELEKLITDFTYQNGLETRNVITDFLRYIVHGCFLPNISPPTDWGYTPEQGEVFGRMFLTWAKIMDKKTAVKGWFDAFGDLYMALTSKRGQQDHGQFFTPAHMCDLMSEITAGDGKTEIGSAIYDPACGSGRNLLSANYKSPKNYLVGWDIDYTCCLMTVCNFFIHGCVGEVVCINTLTMRDFRGAWLVNEALYRTGLPSIRHLTEEEYTRFQRAKIPHYVHFLDQEAYDQYFKWRNVWQTITNLFPNDTTSNSGAEESPDENQSTEPGSASDDIGTP